MKNYRFQSAILALAMITGCAVDSEDPTPQDETTSQEVGGTCNQYVQLGTVYFSNASQSTVVGDCTITCAQWVNGSADPFPGQGAHCEGNTASAYHVPYLGLCHGCRL